MKKIFIFCLLLGLGCSIAAQELSREQKTDILEKFITFQENINNRNVQVLNKQFDPQAVYMYGVLWDESDKTPTDCFISDYETSPAPECTVDRALQTGEGNIWASLDKLTKLKVDMANLTITSHVIPGGKQECDLQFSGNFIAPDDELITEVTPSPYPGLKFAFSQFTESEDEELIDSCVSTVMMYFSFENEELKLVRTYAFP